MHYTAQTTRYISTIVGQIGSGVQVFEKNRPPRGSVRVRTHLVGRLGGKVIEDCVFVQSKREHL